MDVVRILERQEAVRERLLRFLVFHKSNPQVYELFEQLTLRKYRERRDTGKTLKYGARAIWEELRYELPCEIDSGVGKFALDNRLTSYFGRLCMARNPGIGRFFKCLPAQYEVDDPELLRWANEIDAARAADSN